MGKCWSWTEESKKKVRGRGNHNYGKHWNLTEETKRNISESKKGKYCGKNSPRYGTFHSLESIKKMSESKKGKNHPMYGTKWTEERRDKMRELSIEQWKKPKYRERMSGENHYNYGKPLSEEHKRSISKSNKSKHFSKKTEYKKGKDHPLYGKKLSKTTRNKIGDWHRDKYVSLKTKKKMSASKQGISLNEWEKFTAFEPYTFDFNERFKKSIKERDFHCCQMCNIGEDDLLLLKRCLVIHHIDYNKLLSIPQNCITLCNKCNTIANYNRKQWTEFFQSLLKERHNYQYTQDQKVILDYTKIN